MGFRPSSHARTNTVCSTAISKKIALAVMRKHGLGLLALLSAGERIVDRQIQTATRRCRRAPASPTSARHADRSLNARNWRIVEALSEFAAERGHTLLELAMSWLASRPFISSIIAGATKPEQVEQNIAAVGWALSPADLAEIDRITL